MLPVVGPVAPDLPWKVAAEVATYLLGSRIPAVEESAGGEVVELTVYVELPVGDYLLVRVVLKVAEALEDVLCGDVSRLRRYDQGGSPFFRGCFATQYVPLLCKVSVSSALNSHKDRKGPKPR